MSSKKKGINTSVIAEHFQVILEEGLGLDISDPNFMDTPLRVANSYQEIFSGLSNTKEDVEQLFTKCFPTDYKGIVFEKNIVVFSMCPHHFLPVRYEVAVGYVPTDCGIGLSKLVRIVELLAKKPELQETYTEEIVELMETHMRTEGAICMVRGEHYCMQMRGVRQKDVASTTSAARGTFLTQPELELKFYNLINST